VSTGRTFAEGLFWSIHLALLIFQPSRVSRRHAGTVLVALGTLGTAFAYWLLSRDWPGAIFGASLAISGTWAYYTSESTSYQLARLEGERDALAGKLEESILRDERMRIARELHDGIGASLTALLWRAQRIRRQAPPEMTQGLDELVQRAQSGLGDLRSTTWALKTSRRGWSEVVDYIRQRAVETLAGAEVVDTSEDEARDRDVTTALGLAALRVVEIAMREAGAGATRIELALADAGTVDVTVDTSAWSAGRLERVTARLAALGAGAIVQPAPTTSRLVVRVTRG
jgi:two-component system, NarL family, sensor histidine kinase DesK